MLFFEDKLSKILKTHLTRPAYYLYLSYKFNAMINLLRKVRRNLLQEGQLTRYLFYALGEVILVVVGILLALYINNKNETAKAKAANTILLQQLQEENRVNIKDLEEDIAYRDTIVPMLGEFHQFLKTASIETEQEALKNYLYGLSRATSYASVNNYLKKYISSTHSYNSVLTEELIQLDANQYVLKTISEKALDLKFEKFLNYLSDELDFETLESTKLDKIKSLEFRNNILLIASLEEGVKESFDETYNQLKVVDSLITTALE